jgi:hypothetical protein
MKERQGLLQKSGLAGTGARNEADGQYTGFAKALTERTREDIVLF